MTFSLADTFDLLARTPATLAALLRGIPDQWANRTEGGDTWSAVDVVGHLVHSEETNFIPRARLMLAGDPSAAFEPFDRFAQRTRFAGVPLDDLLDRFAVIRSDNLAIARSWNLSTEQLELRAIHPEFGPVTLRQLLSTWAVHDLTHLAQITRAMAGRYREEVGPWIRNLRVLRSP